ncbi:MAG: CHAT domain-containing protein [Dermatophilaceae bacterium]
MSDLVDSVAESTCPLVEARPHATVEIPVVPRHLRPAARTTLDVPDVSDVSQTPDAPDVPDVSDVSQTPDAPDVPDPRRTSAAAPTAPATGADRRADDPSGTTGISDASEPHESPERPWTEVRVAHGDLRFARDHVLVGHYPGASISGGEAALDQLLGGRLSRAAQLGIYPGPAETCQVFTDPADWASPPGAIVAGLGPMGELSAATLARACAHAALTAAMARLSTADRRRDEDAPPEVLQLRLASVLVGTGGAGGLPVRDSVQAILTGIQRANDRLRDTAVPVHIARVQFLELWQDRALQALDAVHKSLASSALEYAFLAERSLRELPGRQRRLVFGDSPGWWQRVRVRCESDGGLTFEASIRRAGAPIRTVPTQRALVDRLVEQLVDSPTPDPAAARALFELLFPNDLKAKAPDTDNVVLVVDPDAARYPWELLDDHGTEAGRVPLGVRRGLLRQLEGSAMRSHVLSATNARALVVGDSDSGLAPLPAAQAEARSVAEALTGHGFRTECLVTASGQSVVQALFDGAYRVVHLAGHGVYRFPVGDGPSSGVHAVGGSPDGAVPTVTGMVLGRGMYLTAAEIGQMRQVPELVFVNCCHLGTVAGEDRGSRPAANFHKLAASFATELIAIGVRAVVACGWAVDDEAAGAFADALYAALLDGSPFGEAVKTARRTTWEAFPDVNTWGAYQCYGDPDYVLVLDPGATASSRTHDLACLQAAEVEIENLSHAVEVTRDTRVGLRRLEQIQSVLADAGLDGPGLHIHLARAYHRLGSYEKASGHFQAVLDAGGSALTVADFELWIDQGVRILTSGLDPAAMTDQAVQTIDESIGALRRFLANPTTMVAATPTAPGDLPGPAELGERIGIDRLWRVASAYKRLALLTCPARGTGRAPADADWTRCRQALADMADWYAAASGAAHRLDSRQYGALANSLVAEAALRWRPGPGRAALPLAAGRAAIANAREGACRAADHRPTFSGIVACADLAALEVLWGVRPSAAAAAPVLGLYRRAARVGSDEQLLAIRDQVDFLCLMAGRSSKGRRAFLTALRDGLGTLNPPAGAPATEQPGSPVGR